MASSTANSDLEERPTRLTGKRDGWSFEIWVKVEDEPLKVYAEAELEEGGSEAWIASQEGKPYVIGCYVKNDNVHPYKRKYPHLLDHSDLRVDFFADGTSLGGVVFGHLCSGAHHLFDFAGRRMSAGKIQEMLFAKPELTEDDTPGLALKDLATIEVVFSRCRKLSSRPWTDDDNAKDWDTQPNGPINEKTKKDAMLGAVTKFGNLTPSVVKTTWSVQTHPEDKERGFFRMQFRYGPKDLLQALGHIPLKVSKDFGAAGLREDQPIEFNDEDEPGIDGGSLQNDQAAVSNEISDTARQIAALQAQLDALKEEESRKRKAAEQEDTKPQILERMGKKLKVAKEEDGGFVDLTGDD